MARATAPKNPAQPAKDPSKKVKPIKVRATRTGYYDHARRREGDVFICDESAFSATWMERVSKDTPESYSTSQDAIDKAHDELLAVKAGAQNTGGEGGI